MSKSFVPMKKMFERVEASRDFDPVLFEELLYAGEFLTKITVLAAMALLDESEEEDKYRYLYDLVRTSNLSTWAETFKSVVTGTGRPDPLAAFTVPRDKGTWQSEAIAQLRTTIAIVMDAKPGASTKVQLTKVQLYQWFPVFASLRNATRGHGATLPARKTEAVEHLWEAVTKMSQNNPLFSLPWVYLHRNQSGKYSLKALSESADKFPEPNSTASTNLKKGIYISWARRPRQVPFLFGDIDARDFFVPNGNPKKGTFEIHSAISGDSRRCDLKPYDVPKSRPRSETEGASSLESIGNTLTNLPMNPRGYIQREKLEEEIYKLLVNDRHPIVTLIGRGGIGKTSAALTVLRKICSEDRFDMLVWFSARDIDLTNAGPKSVQPHTRTQDKMSREYCRLIEGLEDDITPDTLERHLGRENGLEELKQMRRLFVFDNFETVAHPMELYEWIDTHVRLPNKVLITSRFRDFKGDYPIEVTGMEEAQARKLIADTCRRLKVYPTLKTSTIDNIISESEGHPYVIKILVGIYADRRSVGRPTTLMTRKDDILSALFEKTYDNLTPLGVRLFLTLSAWRSLQAQIVIEAMLHWRVTESVTTPESAVEELSRVSLIEVLQAKDGSAFLRVPVVAAIFGRGKLEVNEQHDLIMADVKLLQRMVHTAESSFHLGIGASIRSLFRVITEELKAHALTLGSVRGMLEFVASHHTPAWRSMAELEEEVGTPKGEVRCLRLFLEHNSDHESAGEVWSRLVDVCRRRGDVIGSYHAFLHAAQKDVPELKKISEMVCYINSSNAIQKMDPNQRAALLRPLAGIFRGYESVASADDLSRLAWLSLYVGDQENARKHAFLGIEREPDNVHCRRLIARLREE